ncbi:MAG: YfiR family protein [Candidatus Sulfotelmatobacter sp.]
MRMIRLQILQPISFLVLLVLSSILAGAQKASPTESEVKAAYLYNFGKFVRWQENRRSADSLTICVLGKDPFGTVLDSTVEGESIDGRKIMVKRLASLQESEPCSILFVGVSEEHHLVAILNVAQRQGMLTVSDIAHFAQRGGVIGFVTQQDKIRFEVNRGVAEQSHLTLSSELLKVASKVIEKVPPQT